MSESSRSFWSTIPGFVTGLAGLLTAIVGLVTVLIQLDVIGGDDGNQSVGTAGTTVVPGAQSPGGGATATTEAPRFTVSPATLDFKPADPREKTVTVKNTSDTATLTLSRPEITGQDQAQFSVSAGTCSAPLKAGLSCEMKVTFTPAGPLRSYNARLQLSGGARSEEVRLTGTTLLA
jgi:hypothetical protein